ncbi:hypothetical protein TNCV_741931 [Trichonephila clavipes]|nr:hypothetical protein TNCV_741931 [Trichonephila clavipes]
MQKDLDGMYLLPIDVRSSGQKMVLSQENQVPSGHVALLIAKITVFGVRLWRIALRCGRNSSSSCSVAQRTGRNRLLQE